MQILITLALFCGCFLFPLSLQALTLGEQLRKGSVGDYTITEQENNYSLLLLRALQDDTVLLEEITIPREQFDLGKQNWRQWLKEGAKGHTSWILYEINLKNYTLVEAFSVSKGGWIYLEGSDHFLTRLLSLPLSKVALSERKHIGPSPRDKEFDLRPLWNPPYVVEGKKNKTSFDAWKALWPKDDSLLSSCQIQVYMVDAFAFPYWVEASNGHFTYAIKAVDSGRNLSSPYDRQIPHRPPLFLAAPEKKGTCIEITLQLSPYYKSFSLFVFSVTNPAKLLGPIPFQIQRTDQDHKAIVEVAITDLQTFAHKNSLYKWVLVPTDTNTVYVESEDLFRMP